jgi:bifunctional non-homologous end joining protein LigD
MARRTIDLNGRVIELSSQQKVYFPDAGLTKGDVVDYYRRIAPTMLPHLQDRPLSMQRFPEGIASPGFYQKEVPEYFPGWIRRVAVMVEEEGQEQPQVVCDDAATLVYLANQGCITPHAWLSRAGNLRRPDKLIFDLDPPGGDFQVVRAAAQALRELLSELELPSFLMTTGSKGLHVALPLDGRASYERTREFARDVAAQLVARDPERYTLELRKDAREGRLFLDYLRNAYAATSVAPYAVRARPGAPVATPLDWDELGNRDLHSATYTLENIFRRLGQKQDPWRDFYRVPRALDEARRRLERIQPGD